ncbi:MAG: hypothetical protein O6758_06920, partial [Planctomycetota bacterium]|nr:hypothetical protein [Planctomycetota bacterium]
EAATLSTLGRAVRTGMILGVTASAVGCATLHEAESADAAIDRGSADTLRSATGPDATRLAQQAQRDVQQLRQVRERVDPTAPTASISTRPVIQWIEPSPPPPAGAPASAGITIRGEARSRPPSEPPPQEPEQPDQVVLVEPADTAGEDRLRQLVVQLSAELYRQAAYRDMPLPELLLIAATTMVSPDRALAPDAIPGLTDRERELILKMQTFFAQLGQDLVKTQDPEAIVAAVNALYSGLADEPQLRLPHVALCTEVRGFGDYDQFPLNPAGRYAFLAHSRQQVVIYVEIEDFTSELNNKGQWLTELSQQWVVYSDSDGIPVWREDWQVGVDLSRNRREDFWIVQVITLPKELSLGRYQLKIHIRDEMSGAEAETAIDFEMVADPRLAGT